MPKLRVLNMSLSLDGYAAGPDQGVDDPRAGALRVRRARLLAGRHPPPPRPQGVTSAPGRRLLHRGGGRRAAGAPI